MHGCMEVSSNGECWKIRHKELIYDGYTTSGLVPTKEKGRRKNFSKRPLIE